MTTVAKITTAGKYLLEADILQLILDVIQFGELGTGYSVASEGDTDMDTTISGSNRRWESATISGDEITLIYRAGFDEFDGSEISEIGGKDSEGNLYFRISFTPQIKDTTKEFIFTVKLKITITLN